MKKSAHDEETSRGIGHEPDVDAVRLSKLQIPFSCLFALSLLHLDTYGHIWIHLTNSHHPCKTVWSAP